MTTTFLRAPGERRSIAAAFRRKHPPLERGGLPPHSHIPLRDAARATALLLALIALGSDGFRSVDPTLLGYLGATLVAAFATTWRVSAFWRRPASAPYARALLASLREPRQLRRALAHAGRDLAVQAFIRRRARGRWLAHLLLVLGTVASFAITLPLVFGWLTFVPAGDRQYRVVAFTVPLFRFDVGGVLGWGLFHGLSLAAVAVTLGAAYFLVARLRARRLPGATGGFSIAPLVLLLAVALSGLALPASRGWPAGFLIASWLHEALVIVLLVALPFSKLGHVLIRPLQIGARLVRAGEEPWLRCCDCGVRLAPVVQHRAVAAALASPSICPRCRRRRVALAQAALIGGGFQPRLGTDERECG